MTEVYQALETMYDTESRERNNKRIKTQPDYAMVAAVVLVGITGFLVPTPANMYVWIVGIAGIIVAKNLL